MAKSKTKQADPFFMAGTERTGSYLVIAVSSRGRVGLRKLGGGVARVRVEPGNKPKGVAEHFANGGWKRPGDDGQNRFSKVTGGPTALKLALKKGLHSIGVGDLKPVKIVTNPKAPKWARDYVAKQAA